MTPENIDNLLCVLLVLGITVCATVYILVSRWIDRKYDR